MSDSFEPHELYSPWNSPGQNTGVGSLPLLQGIFPTQGSKPGLPHCRQILYQLSPKGSPTILEWVAWPFSSGSSWPRNQTRVSCIAGGFFTNWAMREGESLGWEDPLEKELLPTPVFWPGEFHILYSQWGHKESDTTERLIWSDLITSFYHQYYFIKHYVFLILPISNLPVLFFQNLFVLFSI